MGLLNGRIACRRYRIEGGDPAWIKADTEGLVAPHTFVPFEDRERTKTAGWVPTTDWFRSPVEQEDIHLDAGLAVLTLREDSRSVPKKLLKQVARVAAEKLMLQAGREYLTRAERDEMLTAVHAGLLSRALPTTKGIDLVATEDRVYVLNCGESANDTIRVLWEKTFGFKLVALTPQVLVGERDDRNRGSDFLRWLWYRSDVGDIPAEITDRIAFADPETGKQQIVVRRGGVAETVEARASRAAGKLITDARFHISTGAHDYTVTIRADTLDLIGVKLPPVLPSEEGDDWRATAMIRYGYLKELWEVIDEWWKDHLAAPMAGEIEEWANG